MLYLEFQVVAKETVSQLNEIVFDDGLHPYPSEVPCRTAVTLDKGTIVFFFLIDRIIGGSSDAELGQWFLHEQVLCSLFIEPDQEFDVHHITQIHTVQAIALIGILSHEAGRMGYVILKFQRVESHVRITGKRLIRLLIPEEDQTAVHIHLGSISRCHFLQSAREQDVVRVDDTDDLTRRTGDSFIKGIADTVIRF